MPINPSEDQVIKTATPETQDVVKINPSQDASTLTPWEVEDGPPVLVPPTDVYNPYLDTGLTEDDVIELIRGENMFANYKTQDIDDVVGGLYVGKQKPTGEWLIEKYIFTGDDVAIAYANLSNNPSNTTYSSAWTGRLSLTYTLISNLSGL